MNALLINTVLVSSFLYGFCFEQTSQNTLLESMVSEQEEDAPEYAKNLVLLLGCLSRTYFTGVPVILYDSFHSYDQVFKTTTLNKITLELGRPLRQGLVHGYTSNLVNHWELLIPKDNEYLHYLIFLRDIANLGSVFPAEGSASKIVVVVRSASWRVKEFLSSHESRLFPNIMVIALLTPEETDNNVDDWLLVYGHRLISDSLYTIQAVPLASWRSGVGLSQRNTLFPDQFQAGFGGRRFGLAASQHPPYIISRKNQEYGEGYRITRWEGLEVKLIQLIGEKLNFTVDMKEPLETTEESSNDVLRELIEGRADIAIGSIYMTPQRYSQVSLTLPHFQDCAAFISLAPTALPKYRAVMGPFLLDVWLVVILTYLLAGFPIAFSVWRSFKPLLKDPTEMQNMFWYVFGTFTNCFTFAGKNSWNRHQNTATKIFIGSYWAFTIIMTASYTGSIIAFITLPVFPNLIDTAHQLLEANYKIITLGSGGWARLLNESCDAVAQALYPGEGGLVQDVPSGLSNLTQGGVLGWKKKLALFGSKELLEYTVCTQFLNSAVSRGRSLFHVSSQCFLPMQVSLALPLGSHHLEPFNSLISRLLQSGLIEKIKRDVYWDVYRTAEGKLVQQKSVLLQKMAPDDRRLTLDDVQGTFLVLGVGLALASAALAGEVFLSSYRKGRSRLCKLV